MKQLFRQSPLWYVAFLAMVFTMGFGLASAVIGIQTHQMSNRINQACGQTVRNPDTCNRVKQEALSKGYRIYVGFDGDWTVK